MINKIADFEKVSFEVFKKEYLEACTFNMPICNSYNGKPHPWDKTDTYIRQIYDKIALPVRSTKGSAGYDFVTPFSFILPQNCTIRIPTGIKCNIDDGWVLLCHPRSSYGNKWRLQFDDTTPVIDSDFYGIELNEGHIFFQFTNDSKLPPVQNRHLITGTVSVMPNPDSIAYVDAGERICQGVFLPHGITRSDNVTTTRTGTSGSTGK